MKIRGFGPSLSTRAHIFDRGQKRTLIFDGSEKASGGMGSFSEMDGCPDWLIRQRDSDDSGFMEGEEPAEAPARHSQRSVHRRSPPLHTLMV